MSIFNSFGDRGVAFGKNLFPIAPFGTTIFPDTFAINFINAAGITDGIQQNAIIRLVYDLKFFGLWDKMLAIYPFVGSTSTTHKFNLVNPVDTNAAYRLVFAGGFTHNSNGITGNGLNAIANTFMNAFTVLPNASLHCSWYSLTANTSNAFSNEITLNGLYNPASWISFRINNKTGGGNAIFSAGLDSAGATVSQTLNGFFIGSKTASNSRKLYRNGGVIATNTTNDLNPLPNLNISLMGGLGNYSGNNCAFSSIGIGLTDTESANLYTAVQAFNTTIGRQV
jgi:hypothetical protein